MKRLALATLLSALAACHHQNDTELVITVTASGTPPPIATLDVTLNGPPLPSPVTRRYARDDGSTLAFPTTLSAQLPANTTGTLSVDVDAKNAAGASVASGHQGSIMVSAGQRETVTVQLDCGGESCVVDGGVGNDDGGSQVSPRCGNGRVDPGETCDTAIAAGYPGACPPPSCDDHIACTRDIPSGSGCTLSCAHQEIETPQRQPSDGCCPHGATSEDDIDCSKTCGDGVVEVGETCDLTIAPGAPGACPTDADCKDAGPCFHAQLVSAGTCSAICMMSPVVAQIGGDGCCPAGAIHAGDSDCPVVCGDGVLDKPEEACDTGLAPAANDACPVSCDDGQACTTDYIAGDGCQARCQHDRITAPLSGDGCCPEGANQRTDTDCQPKCGNNVIERGETCDPPMDTPTNRQPNTCPTSCPPSPFPCLRSALVGSAADCTAHCVLIERTDCSMQPDPPGQECCPASCTPDNDYECQQAAMLCGDGFVETANGEHCDVGAPPGNPTACPTSSMSCIDRKGCRDKRLVSAGSCAAQCLFPPTTSFLPGDGCCPMLPGANFTLDPDCSPVCGNGVVESPAESCDWAVDGSCPTVNDCPPPTACTRYLVKGTSGDCSATCVPVPTKDCVGGDDCCPAGCNAANDSDCAVVCGNGIVETGETCDSGITAGLPGACPPTCDDGNACTRDLASGSDKACTRACVHQPITACLDDDGCCPTGCSAATDKDCAARCGDGKVGAGETCDPPTACPTACPDDGDSCTVERLTGSAATCDATCLHVPITGCSGATRDSCCPTGCTSANDSDCF